VKLTRNRHIIQEKDTIRSVIDEVANEVVEAEEILGGMETTFHDINISNCNILTVMQEVLQEFNHFNLQIKEEGDDLTR